MAFEHVFGLKIAATTLHSAVNTVCKYLPKWQGEYITFVNVHTLVLAEENQTYFAAQQGAVVRFADGYPVAKYLQKHGHRAAERVAGPDFMDAIFQKSVEKGYTHYFYGSSPDSLCALKKQLQKRYPGIEIVGLYAPPVRTEWTKEQMEQDIERMNAAHPDFIWIGLGAPKQELWMHAAQGKVTGLMLGVGAGLDFHAERMKRAPLWMQSIGLEWFYRLLQEPGRLGPRYLQTNFKFIQLCLQEKYGWKKRKRNERD